MTDKKININNDLFRQLELYCFFKGIKKKQLIEKILVEFFKHNKIPKKIEVTQDFKLKVVK